METRPSKIKSGKKLLIISQKPSNATLMTMSSTPIDQDLIATCTSIKKHSKTQKNVFSNFASNLRLSSGFVRGYQRKGTAQFYLGKVDDAILTYKDGLKLDPNNAALLSDLKAA